MPAEPTRRLSAAQRAAIALLPPVAALLLRALDRTLHYAVIVEPGATAAEPPGAQIWCLWHRCLIPCLCYFRKDFEPTVLISRSFDGELVARTIELLGYRTARGSSTRRGAGGLLALAKAAREDRPLVITADGPRGPLYQAKPGAAKLAQITGRAIGVFYALPEKAWQLGSWDRFLIPKPFSRVIVSYARRVPPPPNAEEETLEAARQEVEAALERARENAERHFRPAHTPATP